MPAPFCAVLGSTAGGPGPRRLMAAVGEGATVLEEGAELTLAWQPPRRPPDPRRPGARAASVETQRPSPADRVVVALDGRIFNSAAIAEELVADGLPAPALDDEAAVVALAYRRWGEAMLDRLRGDFALLAWDRERREALIARDQLGARSVYLRRNGSTLAVASELPQLLSLLDRRPDPDSAAVACWLSSSPIPAGRTLYAGVERLAPGHRLRVRDGRVDSRRYWAPTYRPPLRGPADEIAGAIRDRTVAAVRARSSPGRRTGVLLSGGLDSTAIAAIGSRALVADRRPAGSYSAVFPDHPGVDESRWIQALGDRVGLPGTAIAIPAGGVVAGALEYQGRWGVPPIGPGYVFERLLYERARADGVEAMLDGEGGDEAFGVRRFLLADRLLRGRPLAALALTRRFPGAGAELPRRLRWQLLRDLGVKGALPGGLLEAARGRRGAEAHAPAWLRGDSAREAFESDRTWEWKDGSGPRWWRELSWVFAQGIDALGIFDQLRRRAAAAGIEEHQPLLDLELVELALRIPPDQTFDPMVDRALFRRGMASILPDELRLRIGKARFDTFMLSSLEADLPQARRLLDGGLSAGSHVEPTLAADQLLRGPAAHPRGASAWAEELWRLLTLECWLREQEGRTPTFFRFPERGS